MGLQRVRYEWATEQQKWGDLRQEELVESVSGLGKCIQHIGFQVEEKEKKGKEYKRNKNSTMLANNIYLEEIIWLWT